MFDRVSSSPLLRSVCGWVHETMNQLPSASAPSSALLKNEVLVLLGRPAGQGVSSLGKGTGYRILLISFMCRPKQRRTLEVYSLGKPAYTPYIPVSQWATLIDIIGQKWSRYLPKSAELLRKLQNRQSSREPMWQPSSWTMTVMNVRLQQKS